MHRHSSHCTRGLSLEDRLLHYLPHRPEDGCWPWDGPTNRRGYGVLGWQGGQLRAHRAAYEVWVGPIPDGLTIDHVVARGCTTTLCCNPAHLEAVTAVENVMRGTAPPVLFARATHCVNGHPFAGANLVERRVGDRTYRDCLTCRRERSRRYEEKRKAHRQSIREETWNTA